MNSGIGGPFGAVIADEKGNIIAVCSNTVLRDNDPTAHAEVNVIREACRKLKTHNLSNFILYTTCYPCPMCISAAIWANIHKIYYGATKEDAKMAGFKDDFIYNYIESGANDNNILEMHQVEREKCVKLFEEYIKISGEVY